MRKPPTVEVPRAPLLMAIRALKAQALHLERDAKAERRVNPGHANVLADEAQRQLQAVAQLTVKAGPGI